MKNKILYLIVLFIVLFLLIIKLPKQEVDVLEPKESYHYLNKITGDEISDNVKEIIITYMDLYYRSLKELNMYDMDYLFSNDNVALKNREAISLLIEIRKMQKNDLRLSKASYDLDIKVKDNNQYLVLENSYLQFNFMDSMSNIYNIENNFTIENIDGEYKITNFDKVQDFFVMLDDGDYTRQDYLELTKKRLAKDEKFYQSYLDNGVKPLNCDHSYDRKKALDYALTWVNKRNSDWVTYDANCQNYASQVLYMGGIPMDHYGSKEVQWKAYSASYNEKEVPNGLVYTWTYVPYFASYVKENTGYGICARYDENIYYAEAGDIIHVGSSGPTRHALVVIGSVKKDDKVIDILVNSNTVDLENYPLSAYVYPYISLIKVYGWNN